jgi:DDE superfamily endonuclease/transposase
MPPSTPKRGKSNDLSRDKRVQAKTLRSIGWKYDQIASELGITQRQVQTACQSDHSTPKRRTGRKSVLTEAQVDELTTYVRYSRTTRLMSYLQLANGPFAHWQVGEYTIKHALLKRGFKRYIARQKPPLSEVNKAKRLQWAQEHVNWTQDQWHQILWTDETWVTSGRHKKQWITRLSAEELDPTCVIDKLRKKRGWMFWGSFSGGSKGPSLFWEKEWGSIGQVSYCERIIPLIHGWLRMNPHLQLMQDGAPGHSAGETQEELRNRGITPIFWPPYSPDLNPIETVWNLMKDYVESLGDRQVSYPQLRQAVRDAWDSIEDAKLLELIATMPHRCQDVIDAQGGFTKW